MEKEIGIGAAAELLGISISTLKRLCDENLIPSVRTPGGHRRFDRAEVELVGQSLVGHTQRIKADFSDGVQDKIEFMLLTGHAAGLEDLFKTQLDAGLSLPGLFDGYLTPALKQLLGNEASSIDFPPLCHQTALRLVNRLSNSYSRQWSGAPVALGGSLGGPVDQLTSKMVEATLRSARVHALHLEGDMDVNLLASSARQLGAHSIWLAHLVEATSDHLVQAARELRSLLPEDIALFLYCGASSGDEVSPPWTTHTTFQSIWLREGKLVDSSALD